MQLELRVSASGTLLKSCFFNPFLGILLVNLFHLLPRHPRQKKGLLLRFFQDYCNRGEARTQSELNSVKAKGWGVFMS